MIKEFAQYSLVCDTPECGRGSSAQGSLPNLLAFVKKEGWAIVEGEGTAAKQTCPRCVQGLPVKKEKKPADPTAKKKKEKKPKPAVK